MIDNANINILMDYNYPIAEIIDFTNKIVYLCFERLN